jgi:hypothetical protein
MKLAKLLDWPKELFAWDTKAKLSAKLNPSTTVLQTVYLYLDFPGAGISNALR